MSTLRRFLFVALAVSLAFPAVGQVTEPLAADALSRYRAESLRVIPRAFGMSEQLWRGDQEVSPGFFGGDAEDLFGTSPRAMEAMEDYRTFRIAGFSLWAAGLAALIADLALVLAEHPSVIDEGGETTGLYWGLLIGGLVTGAGGGLLVQSAQGYLGDAIEFHNEDLAQRLQQASQGSPALKLSFTTGF
jgi:hypothetical protein